MFGCEFKCDQKYKSSYEQCSNFLSLDIKRRMAAKNNQQSFNITKQSHICIQHFEEYDIKRHDVSLCKC